MSHVGAVDGTFFWSTVLFFGAVLSGAVALRFFWCHFLWRGAIAKSLVPFLSAQWPAGIFGAIFSGAVPLPKISATKSAREASGKTSVIWDVVNSNANGE